MQKRKALCGGCHLLALNMMMARSFSHAHFSVLECFIFCLPILIGLFALALLVVPELTFFAECQNIPGGDICSISLK